MEKYSPSWAIPVPTWLVERSPSTEPVDVMTNLRFDHREAIPYKTLPNAEKCSLVEITVTANNVPEYGCLAVTYVRKSHRHGKGRFWHWQMKSAFVIDSNEDHVERLDACG